MSSGSVNNETTTSLILDSSLPLSSSQPIPTPRSINDVTNYKQLGPKLKRKTEAASVKQRIAIATLYFNCYASSSFRLKGRGGIISRICKRLNAPPPVVHRVVTECISNTSRGEAYNARRKQFDRQNLQKIKRGSVQEHLVSVYKENHHSNRATADFLNAITCLKNSNNSSDYTYVSKTAVFNAVQRMRHRKLKTVTISQASNKNKHLQQACLNYFAQLLVCYGPLPSL